MDYKEQPIRSGYVDLTSFTNGPVWADIREYLEDRLELLRDDLLAVDTLPAMKLLQGEALAIESFLGYPQHLIDQVQNNASDE